MRGGYLEILEAFEERGIPTDVAVTEFQARETRSGATKKSVKNLKLVCYRYQRVISLKKKLKEIREWEQVIQEHFQVDSG